MSTIYGWLCAWNTGTVPDGSYVLVSGAFNSAGTAFGSGVSITVDNTNSTPTESDQAPLALTSTSGVSGQALTLTTSGGSGTGDVSYAVTDGTASGCTIFTAALTSTSAGTCIVTATKAADANYNAISSAPTTVTFTAPAPAFPQQHAATRWQTTQTPTLSADPTEWGGSIQGVSLVSR